MTIRWKLFILIFIFMTAVLLIFWRVESTHLEDLTNRLMNERVRGYVQLKAVTADQLLAVYEEPVRLLSTYVAEMKPVEEQQALDTLVRSIAGHEDIETAFAILLNDKGQPITQIWYGDDSTRHAVVPMEPIQNLKATPFAERLAWFTEPVLSKQVYWSSTDAFMSRVGEERAFYHTRPVLGHGKVIAVVGVTYQASGLEKLVHEMSLGGKSYGVLFDTNLDFFYHPIFKQGTNLKTAYEGHFKDVAEYLKAHPEVGEVQYTWFDHRGKTFAYQRLQNGWILGLTMFSEILEPGKSEHKLPDVVKIGLPMALGASVLLSLLLALVVTNPLKDMVRVLQEMSRGHYEVRVRQRYMGRRDEIGHLTVAIEKTRELQRGHLEGLAEYQLLLESKVLERTEALVRANEELEISLATMEEKHEEMDDVREVYQMTKAQLDEANCRIKRADDLAVLGTLATTVVLEISRMVDSTAGMATYLRAEARSSAPESQAQLSQNVEDGADLILQNTENLQEWMQEWALTLKETREAKRRDFSVRRHLKQAVDKFESTLKGKMPEVVVLCDDEETLYGDEERFNEMIHLLLTEAVEQVESGHIYMRFEVKDKAKKLIFSQDGQRTHPSNKLYQKALQMMISTYFEGSLVCEEKEGDGRICHLVFKA